MKKNILYFCITMFFILLVFPTTVKANYGDLNYRISSISINDSRIRITGWAFIHRTNNYSGSGHTILLEAYNKTTNSVIETKTDTGRSGHDFYCQLYLKSGEGPNTCTSTSLKNTYHTCQNNSSGVGTGTKCYYESMDFIIEFDVTNWADVSEDDEIIFRIAATNSDFRDKLSYTSYYGAYNYGGLSYTRIEDVYIPRSAVSGTLENDYITLDVSSCATEVEYIAAYAYLIPPNSSFTQGMAAFRQNGGIAGCDSNIYSLMGMDSTYYSIGVNISSSMMPYDFNGTTGYSWFYCPGNRYTFKNYASHMKMTGSSPFKITVRAGKKCEIVTNPNSGNLYCNGSTVFNSDCEELTVRHESSSQSANVTISQTGYISTVLTPDSVYAGGGFNFGIMYTNSVKWSYVRGTQSSNIVSEMNNRIKDYNSYIAGINVTGLKFNGRTADISLKKECTTSNTSKDYLDNELTVTCMFYIPESVFSGDGGVSYIPNSIGLGIENKYYTPMNYEGTYSIEANIEGLNRLVDSYAKEDSVDDSKPWTGGDSKWKDIIENCEINVYPLFYNSCTGDSCKYNFIYRPIDINDPFPNRNAGINWFDWYKIESNKNRLESTYLRLQFVVDLNSGIIANIKNYNQSQNSRGGYLDWGNMNGTRSAFVDEYFRIKRQNIVGDSS